MDQKRAISTLVLLFGGLLGLFLLGLVITVGEGRGGSGTDHARVGVIEIKDTIVDARKTVEQLHKFMDDKSIKALVVRVDSPGGSVGPSQEIMSELQRAVRKKHIVASLGSVAASGGYYVAIGAEKIVTNPGTLTGSIGVIMQHPVLNELMKSAKVDMQTYASGKLKDAGSPFRAPTPEDRAYLQGVTSEIAAQFIDAVAAARGMEREKVAAVADGRVITGKQAVELGLVDELGTLHDAARLALKLAEDTREPELVYPPRKGGVFADLLDEGAESLGRGVAEALSGSTAWQGGLWRLPAVDGPDLRIR